MFVSRPVLRTQAETTVFSIFVSSPSVATPIFGVEKYNVDPNLWFFGLQGQNAGDFQQNTYATRAVIGSDDRFVFNQTNPDPKMGGNPNVKSAKYVWHSVGLKLPMICCAH
jgi:hypothetical protein